MRLIVNCPSGESRLLQVEDAASIHDIKLMLEEQEGVPAQQQVLCFAGQHLQDQLTLADYSMQDYTLSEVVLYLSKRLARPKRIFLTTHAKPSQLTAIEVEADMPIGEVQLLLESRGLAGADSNDNNDSVLIKRQDGSTVPLRVDAANGITYVQQRITEQEGVAPTSLTFCRAQDGVLHCTVHPSNMVTHETYPVYQRNVLPQPTMPKKSTSVGQQTLPEMARELCVLP